MSGFFYLPLSVIWQSARPLGNLSFFSSVFFQFLEQQCMESPESFVEISCRKREDRKMWRKSWAPRSILEKNSQLHYTFLITRAWCARENGQHFTVAEAFSPSSRNVAPCTWSQILGWAPLPVCAYCPWQRLPGASRMGLGQSQSPCPRPLACPGLVLGTAPAAWQGAGMVAKPQLSIQASCHLQVTTYRSVVSSAEISFLFRKSRGLNLCCLGTAELRVDGVWHSLHEVRINIQEGAKQICLSWSPKPYCSLARLYSEEWKLGSKAKWG